MAHTIFIAGSGGIGRAVAMLLRYVWSEEVNIMLGDLHKDIAQEACNEVDSVADGVGTLEAIAMNSDTWPEQIQHADILLDCLPGKLAPKMARIAIANMMHYVNLTEYVAETKEILALAKDAPVGLALQSGLAPGFINVLGHGLLQDFCHKFNVSQVDS